MTHITIEREEAERILHVINSGAGELRQLGLRLAGKTLKQALAQPEAVQPVQEPVQLLLGALEALCQEYGQAMTLMNHKTPRRAMWSKALEAIDKAKEWGQATPPTAQRQWVGLTDDERGKVYADWRWSDGRTSNLALCEAIEAKLKEKNT